MCKMNTFTIYFNKSSQHNPFDQLMVIAYTRISDWQQVFAVSCIPQ